MAVRKSGKSALDYDPLSWLKEDAVDDNEIPGDLAPPVTRGKPAAAQRTAEPVTDTPVLAADTVQEAVEATIDDAATETGPGIEKAESITAKPENITDNSNEYLQLDSELTMKNVAEFKQQIDQLMHRDTPIAIDARDLRKIDSAGLQLLYGLQKSMAKNGTTVNWKQANEVITAAAAIIGMDLDVTVEKSDTAEIEAEQGWGFF